MASKLAKTHWRDELDVWATPILANMLWVLFCIPVITVPLAFTGLFGVMYRWADDGDTQVFTNFFGTIRKTWHKAYPLFALDVMLGSFLYFNLLMFQVMDMGNALAFLSRSATLFVVAIFVATNIVAWVLVATWDVSLKRIIDFSVRLVFAQPIRVGAITIAFVFPFLVSPMLPVAVFVVATGAVAAYIACQGTRSVVGKHLTDAEFMRINLT